ncbi:glycosyltransferase family 4 protein [Candidatus Aminicenantes bacterium AC-335-K20]|jgi:glycosyltransferase involved in cell wall biosynthesis|nr:glycosyltransferase family 4 protein [SCandidatus Aminicenantes bacterium Aminicenantia_JdfR_composite]MCP2597005.1 glycosyltransferase family 4 protein [Candidatus Aminicenantes bacterium AC-335-G13]MCP2606047.1 glycosyltransferase family 4 protein [Candidatus Aminicenantes bacterium AC-708-I09]MCP2618398.1 glycosyltransferase family 4 protein [Candidatus Aminicenantes bacterium AC-335-A11]MCP2619394.1 glycosyltransferase family 4 protein [Candidatus Aminicenantes bacterium AC-335-K20]MCP2
MRIDQILPAFHRGDAIGDTALHIKKFLNSSGFSSNIYSLTIDDELLSEADFFSNFPPTSSSDIVIFHFALPSPLTDEIKKMSAKKIMIYHNITPAEFFADYSAEMTRIAIEGRKQLSSLAEFIDLALADSEFNRQELEEIGYKNTAVFPLFVDFNKYKKKENPIIEKLFDDERVNILFVGRIVPNKKIEDNIKVLFYYKKYISPLVRLIVVGKTTSLPEYYYSLIRLADEFLLTNEDIVFTGHVPDEELIAYYRIADVFLSLSEHEGFCLPLIESMFFDVPIIAYNCTAVPYTLGNAGILVNTKDVSFLGELIHYMVSNKEFREKIINSQRKRLEEFRKQDLGKTLLEYINKLK